MTSENTHVVGTLRTHAGRVVVRLEGIYDTDATDLWSALTEPERLSRWLAQVEGDLRLGGTFSAFVANGERADGTIVVCEPPRRLHVTWRVGDDEETLIAVELVADGDRTRLVLEERGVLASDAAGYGAGWHAFVEALGAHVAGEMVTDWQQRWNELLPAYQEQADALT